MADNQNIILPPKYYLDYFTYLLDFVKDKYRHILNENEWRFLRKFFALTEDAQCLFIRFTNRKGLFFRTENINYEELTDISNLLTELTEKSFIEALQKKHTAFLADLLQLSTKEELLALAPPKTSKSVNKAGILESIKKHYDAENILEQMSQSGEWIKVNFEFETTFLKFLFFGNRYMDMSEFVVRDLGFVQYFQHDDDKLVARFDTRKDAEDKWAITDQTELFEQLKGTESPQFLYDWFITVTDTFQVLSEVAKPTLERLKFKLARHLELQTALELAVEIYKDCKLPPAKERQVRCLVKLKKTEEALALCDELIATGSNADEVLFAKDYAGRILKNTSRRKKLTTEKLHLAASIRIPAIYRGQVELGTIAYFIEQGKNAIFSENHLWRGIFGLVFWEIIFDPSLVAFHHPFQRRPSDLHLPDFYQKRKEILHAHLNQFADTDELLMHMRTQYVKQEGIANPFVLWDDGLWEGMRLATHYIGLQKLKEILIYMAKDIAENSRGFPDLFVWDENSYEFVEVKSPTDNLSNRQLFWLSYFEENDIPASVLRVFFEN